MTLVDVLPAVAADPGRGRDGGGAAWALERLCSGLQVVVELRVLQHQVAGHNRDRELHLVAGTGSKTLLLAYSTGGVHEKTPQLAGNGWCLVVVSLLSFFILLFE